MILCTTMTLHTNNSGVEFYRCSVEIKCAAQEVYAQIADLSSSVRWFPGVGKMSSMDDLPAGTPGKRYEEIAFGPNGEEKVVAVRILSSAPPSELSIESELAPVLPVYASYIEPLGDSRSRLTWTASRRGGGLKALLVQLLLRRVLSKRIPVALDNLRRILETDHKQSMAASLMHRYGAAPDVLSIEPFAARPQPAAGEVLIRQFASSLNHIDLARRAGYGRKLMRLKGLRSMPMVLGNDVYGEVVEVGEGVDSLALGEKVFGAKPPSVSGCFAEYVAVPAELLLPVPDGVDSAQLAASPYAFLSAWTALVTDCGLAPDNSNTRVFVQGGGGAVGSCAVAIAKSMGAYVVANCGPGDMSRVSALGADLVLDYNDSELAGGLSDFDIALCTANPDHQAAMLDILRTDAGARYATLLHPTLALADELGAIKGLMRSRKQHKALNRSLRASDRVAHWSLFSPDREGLKSLKTLLQQDALRLRIAQRFSLNEMVAAQEAMESGVSGKIVIDIAAV